MSVFTLKVIANCTVSDHYLGFKLPDNLQNIFRLLVCLNYAFPGAFDQIIIMHMLSGCWNINWLIIKFIQRETVLL